jgi:hypothetical protein
MSTIKKAIITSRMGRNPIFNCEFQFTAEQVGKTYLLDASYHGRPGRTGEGEGPFQICRALEIVPTTENHSINYQINHNLNPAHRYKNITVELTEMIEKFSTGWPL